ncbi:MAG: hypothetical protein CTY33_09885 [Methylotenera sp.]|nr:MAG: hypothetical protein CTY33_09885 [Methylotenera sp.]
MKKGWPIVLIGMAIVNLVGCATSSKMYGPSGEEMYDISCPGLAVPMSACYEKALKVCPQGYFLASRDTGSGSIGTLNSNGQNATGTYVQGINKGIIIKCK